MKSDNSFNSQFKPAAPDREENGPNSGKPAIAPVASVVLLIITLTLIFYSFNLSSQITRQESTINRLHQQLDSLQAQREIEQELLSVIESKNMQVLSLESLEKSPGSFGYIFLNSDRREMVLLAGNIPAHNDGMYVLWLIRDNEVYKIGSFSVSTSENFNYFHFNDPPVTTIEQGDTYTVTREKDETAPRPLGDRYLIGSINNN